MVYNVIMETVLQDLGLNEKEARFYLYLLNEGSLTAAEIAKQLNESRTNTYMVLEKLAAEGLVQVSDRTAVRQYMAADPSVLKNRINRQMQQIKQTHVALQSVLPELSSIFNLGQHKPGVIYLEGIEGFKTLLEDNARLKQGTIDLLASSEASSSPETWELLQRGIAKRAARGVVTRGLFKIREDKKPLLKDFAGANYEIRFWSQEPLPGEIVIYGNKIAFTVYQPSLIITIFTNEVMAQTFRIIFGQLWHAAKQ